MYWDEGNSKAVSPRFRHDGEQHNDDYQANANAFASGDDGDGNATCTSKVRHWSYDG